MTPVNALPFPRGETMSQGAPITLTDAAYKDLEGKIFDVQDSKHGTGKPVRLRIVKNDSGGDLTVARTFMGFSTTSDYDYGSRSSGLAGAGAPCKPMDDMYVVGFTIPDDDLFYVVESGPCYVNTAAASVDLPAGTVVASAANGVILGDESINVPSVR